MSESDTFKLLLVNASHTWWWCTPPRFPPFAGKKSKPSYRRVTSKSHTAIPEGAHTVTLPLIEGGGQAKRTPNRHHIPCAQTTRCRQHSKHIDGDPIHTRLNHTTPVNAKVCTSQPSQDNTKKAREETTKRKTYVSLPSCSVNQKSWKILKSWKE